ncbi:hydratase [Vibrio sp. WJH972]
MTINYQAAAAELLSRRVAGTKAPRLTEELRPSNTDEALAIQAVMAETIDDSIGGWKCLLPLAEDKFIVAPIFSSLIEKGDTCNLFADNGVVRVEPEIAFILSKALPANPNGYTDEEINEAIGSCHMALELIQSRFADDSDAEFYERLADGLVNQGVFIGPEINREKAFAAANIDITITQGEQVQTFAGKHPNPLPQLPIYWLINFMTRRGVDFKAGEALITGSYCGIAEVEFDQLTTIDYAGLGQYQVQFSAKK